MERPSGSLWRNADFVKLWAGQTVSSIGSGVTGQALPLAALLTLSATPGQMGLLGAVESAPVLLVGLLAGVWVDRLRRRPVLVATDLGRALILITVPAAALLGLLTIWQLYIVAALAGSLTVFFNVADQSYLPTLVDNEQIVEGNSKLGASESIAEVVGPTLGGSLVQLITAPFAILVDAASFLVSAASVVLIRKPEPAPQATAQRQSVWSAIGDGLRLVLRDPVLRAMAASNGTFNFFGGFFAALYSLFIVRDLGLGPAILGLLVSAGGAGALLGAVLSRRVSERLGMGRVLIGSLGFQGLAGLPLVLVSGSPAFVTVVLLATQFVGDIAIAIYFILEVSVRQSIVPARYMGRANATMHFLGGALVPVGALLGGWLGETIGARSTLAIAIAGGTAAALWMLFSPLRSRQWQASSSQYTEN